MTLSTSLRGKNHFPKVFGKLCFYPQSYDQHGPWTFNIICAHTAMQGTIAVSSTVPAVNFTPPKPYHSSNSRLYVYSDCYLWNSGGGRRGRCHSWVSDKKGLSDQNWSLLKIMLPSLQKKVLHLILKLLCLSVAIANYDTSCSDLLNSFNTNSSLIVP